MSCGEHGSGQGFVRDGHGSFSGMRIGLMRHFPVKQAFPSGWRTSAELDEWLRRYDVSDVCVGAFDLGGVAWQACHASDLRRARVTAEAVFRGEIECSPWLREAQFGSFGTGGLRLPVFLWRWVVRCCWATGHPSQRAFRDDFRRRVTLVAERIGSLEKDTLVVSHAGMMAFLSVELRRRGFRGPKLREAVHAKVYLYERSEGELV